jgi:hypothetical protein
VHGPAAMALGIAYIAAGLFAHVHWFWSSYPRLFLLCDVSRLVALLVILAGVGFAVCRILISGPNG